MPSTPLTARTLPSRSQNKRSGLVDEFEDTQNRLTRLCESDVRSASISLFCFRWPFSIVKIDILALIYTYLLWMRMNVLTKCYIIFDRRLNQRQRCEPFLLVVWRAIRISRWWDVSMTSWVSNGIRLVSLPFVAWCLHAVVHFFIAWFRNKDNEQMDIWHMAIKLHWKQVVHESFIPAPSVSIVRTIY